MEHNQQHHVGFVLYVLLSLVTRGNGFVIPLHHSDHKATINTNRIVVVATEKSFLSQESRSRRLCRSSSRLFAQKGFGAKKKERNDTKGKKKLQPPRLIQTLQEKDDIISNPKSKNSNNNNVNRPFVKSEQEQLIQSLTHQASQSCLGKAVTETIQKQKELRNEIDPFWELIPTVLLSRFPNMKDSELIRMAGFLRYSIDPSLILEREQREHGHDPYRPLQDIHAYMPGLGTTQPFYNTSQFTLCTLLHQYYDTIVQEYQALHHHFMQNSVQQKKYGYQSVTSLNYDSGWKTLVLFYNGHRIPGFPYHLCPRTTQILETVPIAGRIAGFNCQQPNTGIPMHTDGNNMWLTCQMGIDIPPNATSFIQVGPERQYWQNGQCIVYDTTYQHYTKNNHPDHARIVLHVDFFNILVMTPLEIDVMQYIYTLREQYMKAEGNTKVSSQIL
jgi:aspartyl/asparaginyl beta-hydroxylase (cupin superfamily)